MTRRTRLETLPGGHAVLEQPVGLSVVKCASGTVGHSDAHTDTLVTASAERLGRMAIAATRLDRESVRTVSLEEVHGVVSGIGRLDTGRRPPGRTGQGCVMAVDALPLHVARRAVRKVGRRRRSML